MTLDKTHHGLLRVRYLKEHRSTVWAELVMEGRLYAHLLEVEDAANDLLNGMMPDIAKAAGATEELKARDISKIFCFFLVTTLTMNVQKHFF